MAKRAEPRLRVLLGSSIAMGPGKADLLDAIAIEGSISGAAKRMGMSYRRAWILVETMNQCFRGPLVDAARGGAGGGGAQLTPLGKVALDQYRSMEAKAAASVGPELKRFRALLNKDAAH